MFIFVSVLSHFLGFGSAYLNITGGGARVLFLPLPVHDYSFREAFHDDAHTRLGLNGYGYAELVKLAVPITGKLRAMTRGDDEKDSRSDLSG